MLLFLQWVQEMTNRVFSNPRPQFTKGDGTSVNSGGKLYFREPGNGSTTLKSVYSDIALTVAYTNPVILDANGVAPIIYLNGDYNVQETDSTDVSVWQVDNYQPFEDPKQFDDWVSTEAYSKNDIVQFTDDAYYISLNNNNTNKTPSSGSTSWSELLSVELYNQNKTYALNEVVRGDVTNNNLFVSLQASNLNNSLTDVTFWGPSSDLNSLVTSTSDGDGDFFAVVDSLTVTKKLTKGNINISGFNNDMSVFAVKATDESVDTSTTLQDDDDIALMVIPTGANYSIDGVLLVDSNSVTPDFKFKLNLVSGTPAYLSMTHLSYDIGGAAEAAASGALNTHVVALDGTNFKAIHLKGMVLASTELTITLQWAQNTSNATATILKAGSYLEFRRV